MMKSAKRWQRRAVIVAGALLIPCSVWAQGVTPAPAIGGQGSQMGPTQPPAAGGNGTMQGQAGVPAGTTALPEDIGTGEKIAKITILGNKNISTDAIQAVLTEKVGGTFDAQAAAKDRDAISAMGYWATPAQFADFTDQKGGVDLTFSLVENPLIQDIRFNANTATGEPTIPAATLLAQMQTKPGQVLNSNTLQSDLDTLFQPGTGYAARQGYLFAVGSSLSITPKAGVLTIPVIETYIQAVQVTGNGKTPTADILSDLPVKQGELYNVQTVQSRLASFRGTGRFHVTGPASVEPTLPGRVVLTVPVTARK